MSQVVPAPDFTIALKKPGRLQHLLRMAAMPEFQEMLQRANEQYVHWHRFRYSPKPDGVTAEEAWGLLKLGRRANYKLAPFADKRELPFRYWIPDALQRDLHDIDIWAGGNIVSDHPGPLPAKEQFIIRSLMDEAIASSQLEGAATTTKKAKELLQTGRKPKDKSEQMILNNWETMQFIREKRKERLTKDLVLEIHQRITEETLNHPEEAGHLRTNNEIVVEYKGDTVHVPPDFKLLPQRLQAFCDFANGDHKGKWIHPVIKAVMLHFWLAYDHPFTDGNGRTARALMYWYLLSRDYLLFEYLAISRYIQRSPGQYVRAYLHTETDENDLTYFFFYNLRATKLACEQVQSYIRKKQSEMAALNYSLKRYPGLNIRQRSLLSHAMQHPHEIYTIDTHKSTHGVVYQTARNDLLDLANKGFLKKEKQGKEFVFLQADKMMDRLRGALST
jgi:Fic family protein